MSKVLDSEVLRDRKELIMDDMDNVELFCTVCTVALFVNGLRSSWIISCSASENTFPVFPFVAPPVCCFLWLRYGMLKNSSTITFVNTVGLFFTTLALAVFWTSVESKSKIRQAVLLAVLGTLSVWWHVESLLNVGGDTLATSRLGFICACSSISMFGAPLVAIREVLEKESTDGSLDLSVCFMNFLVVSTRH